MFKVFNFSSVRLADTRFDGHIGPRPGQLGEGAEWWINHSMASSYHAAQWEPDRSFAEYINARDGWLRNDDQTYCVLPNRKRVWDKSKLDGGDMMRIMFRHLRENREIKGVLLELLQVHGLPGWGNAIDHERFFWEAMRVIETRNRSRKVSVSLNGALPYYVPRVALELRAVTHRKIEGGMWRPEFPDYHDSHDRGGGEYLDGPGMWIDCMAEAPDQGCTPIMDWFGEPDWGSKRLEQGVRLMSALTCIHDGIWIAHLQHEGHWTTPNPWYPFYDILRSLGEPESKPRRSNELHWRKFEGGILLVNPTRRIVRYGPHSVPPMDAVIV